MMNITNHVKEVQRQLKIENLQEVQDVDITKYKYNIICHM